MTNPTLTLGKHTPVFPLIQGGMGVMISGPRLAGAAAKAGGIGTIASVGVACASPHYNGRNYFEANRLALRDALRDARRIAPEPVSPQCRFDESVEARARGPASPSLTGVGLPKRYYSTRHVGGGRRLQCVGAYQVTDCPGIRARQRTSTHRGLSRSRTGRDREPRLPWTEACSTAFRAC